MYLWRGRDAYPSSVDGQARSNHGSVKTVCSHQQSLAQCRLWLDANLPSAIRQSVSSNAEAARLVSESMTSDGLAAVAGERAAETYGLETLSGSIEDRPDNTTRFLVIGKHTDGVLLG